MTKEELFDDWCDARQGFIEEINRLRDMGDNTRYAWEDEVEHWNAWWRENEFHLSRLSNDDRQWIVDRANGEE